MTIYVHRNGELVPVERARSQIVLTEKHHREKAADDYGTARDGWLGKRAASRQSVNDVRRFMGHKFPRNLG